MTEEKPARPWDIFNKNIKKVEEQIHSERMEICNSCPELIKLTNQCKKCGCFMNIKTKLPHATCPLEKWKAIDIPFDREI
jgi:hypothetical protein